MRRSRAIALLGGAAVAASLAARALDLTIPSTLLVKPMR